MNDARQFRRSIPVIEYKLQVLQYLTAESIALETAVNFLFVLRRERGDPTQRTVTNYLGGGELKRREKILKKERAIRRVETCI